MSDNDSESKAKKRQGVPRDVPGHYLNAIEGYAHFADIHNTRGNKGAVEEALQDILFRCAQLREMNR